MVLSVFFLHVSSFRFYSLFQLSVSPMAFRRPATFGFYLYLCVFMNLVAVYYKVIPMYILSIRNLGASIYLLVLKQTSSSFLIFDVFSWRPTEGVHEHQQNTERCLETHGDGPLCSATHRQRGRQAGPGEYWNIPPLWSLYHTMISLYSSSLGGGCCCFCQISPSNVGLSSFWVVISCVSGLSSECCKHDFFQSLWGENQPSNYPQRSCDNFSFYSAGSHRQHRYKVATGKLTVVFLLQVWKEFAAGLDERSSVLALSVMFHQKAEQVCGWRSCTYHSFSALPFLFTALCTFALLMTASVKLSRVLKVQNHLTRGLKLKEFLLFKGKPT